MQKTLEAKWEKKKAEYGIGNEETADFLRS